MNKNVLRNTMMYILLSLPLLHSCKDSVKKAIEKKYSAIKGEHTISHIYTQQLPQWKHIDKMPERIQPSVLVIHPFFSAKHVINDFERKRILDTNKDVALETVFLDVFQRYQKDLQEAKTVRTKFTPALEKKYRIYFLRFLELLEEYEAIKQIDNNALRIFPRGDACNGSSPLGTFLDDEDVDMQLFLHIIKTIGDTKTGYFIETPFTGSGLLYKSDIKSIAPLISENTPVLGSYAGNCIAQVSVCTGEDFSDALGSGVSSKLFEPGKFDQAIEKMLLISPKNYQELMNDIHLYISGPLSKNANKSYNMSMQNALIRSKVNKFYSE